MERGVRHPEDAEQLEADPAVRRRAGHAEGEAAGGGSAHLPLCVWRLLQVAVARPALHHVRPA